jgi:hypothetical protein
MSFTRSPVTRVISLLKDSNPDAVKLYTEGKCYRLALILRERFPSAEIWYCQVEGHVYTKIGSAWYDIRGKHLRVSSTCTLLDHKSGHRPHRWDNMFKTTLSVKDSVRSTRRLDKDGLPMYLGKGTITSIDGTEVTVRWWQVHKTTVEVTNTLIKTTAQY